jgi:hypothetical protein
MKHLFSYLRNQFKHFWEVSYDFENNDYQIGPKKPVADGRYQPHRLFRHKILKQTNDNTVAHTDTIYTAHRHGTKTGHNTCDCWISTATTPPHRTAGVNTLRPTFRL